MPQSSGCTGLLGGVGGLGTPLCHCTWRHSRPSFLTVQLENSKEQSAISGVGEKHPPSPSSSELWTQRDSGEGWGPDHSPPPHQVVGTDAVLGPQPHTVQHRSAFHGKTTGFSFFFPNFLKEKAKKTPPPPQLPSLSPNRGAGTDRRSTFLANPINSRVLRCAPLSSRGWERSKKIYEKKGGMGGGGKGGFWERGPERCRGRAGSWQPAV